MKSNFVRNGKTKYLFHFICATSSKMIIYQMINRKLSLTIVIVDMMQTYRIEIE
jgi:hypothetical protein